MILSAGTRVGHYEIIRPLGKGGMGDVYVGRDVRLDREIALKFISAEYAENDTWKRRFLREAKAASRLTHPNLAVIYEVGEWQGSLFLAMECVKGESLSGRLKRGRMPFSDTRDFTLQLTDVLCAAHQEGIIHRDLKPGNIVVTPEGKLKLLDFGLAKFDVPGGQDENSPTVTALTRPGGIVGTPAYMSPELVSGHEADARTDLFALGIVIYEMASGRHPFTGPNPVTTAANIIHRKAEPMSQWNREIPAQFERIVLKCLEKDPAMRYQSAAKVLEDLRGATGADGSAPAPSRRYLLVAAGAVASGGAAFYAWRTIRAPIAFDSLAVLPIENAGGEDQSFLSDGLTEGLINQLAQVPGLRVMARSAVYNAQIPKNDAIAAGKKLGVKAVLGGRIAMAAAGYSVTAELIEVATARHLWGGTFQVAKELMASIQNEIAGPVLALLGAPQDQEKAKKASSIPAEAYQAYLMGRYQLNKRTKAAIEKSLEYFQEALAKSPDYALAYAGMAAAFNLQTGMVLPKEVFSKALTAAKKAVELDPNLAEAHAILGWIRMTFNWDWPGAETELKHAIQLNGSYPVAHANYATYLSCRKKFGDAIAEVQRAAALDPLSASLSVTLGNVYYLARQTDRAVFHLTNLLKTETRMPVAYFYRGAAQTEQGRFNDAIHDFQTGLAMAPGDSGAMAGLGLAYARAGNAAKAKEQIEKMEQLSKQRYVAPYFLALPYIGLGETDRSVDLLEQAAEDRAFPLIYLGVEPKLDPLRTNPRFRRLMMLVGLQ